MTPKQRLARMQRSFDKKKAVLVEDYEFFSGVPAATPDAPKSRSRVGRKSATKPAKRGPKRS